MSIWTILALSWLGLALLLGALWAVIGWRINKAKDDLQKKARTSDLDWWERDL